MVDGRGVVSAAAAALEDGRGDSPEEAAVAAAAMLSGGSVDHLLDVGMSGLSLVGSLSSSAASVGGHTRKGTESTMSTSPVVMHPQQRRPSSAPVSPATTSERLSISVQRASMGQSSLPSPIEKLHLSRNASTNSSINNNNNAVSVSPQLTLTPNSSEAGDLHWQPSSSTNVIFQEAAGSDVPAMPFFLNSNNGNNRQQRQQQPEHRNRDSSTGFHSFDLAAHQHSNDGLLGLEALRERAASSSSSYHNEQHQNHTSPSSHSPHSPRIQQRSMFPPAHLRSTDRPPLSQSYGGENSSTIDRGSMAMMITGGAAAAFHGTSNNNGGASTNRSRSPPVEPSSFDGYGGPPLGAIGSAAWRGPNDGGADSSSNNRRRASSYGEMQQQRNNAHHQQLQNQHLLNPFHQHEVVSQKFGALPSLQSHLHRGNSNKSPSSNLAFDQLPKTRHTRSISQPGPPQQVQELDRSISISGYNNINSGSGYDADLSHHSYKSVPSMHSSSIVQVSSSPSSQQLQNPPMYVQHHQHSFSSSPHQHQQQSQLLLQQDFLSNSSFASMPNLMHTSNSSAASYGGAGGGGYGYGGSSLDRRDSLEYGANSSVQYAASDGFSSSGHSPHQVYYGGAGSANNSIAGGGGGRHVRQPTAESGASSILSSSQSLPMAYSGGNFPRHFSGDRDDEMSHPLMGEHIEVPDHDLGIGDLQPHHMAPTTYVIPSTHPLLRGQHAHSMSMDAIPDLRPTVVYSVKFKRSQRNFVLGPRITRDLKIGTYVKVEADRGEDLGIVVGKIPVEKFSTYASRSSFSAGMGPSSGGNVTDLKRIIRLATHDEVSLLGIKREEEADLLRICLTKVRQRGLPMNVVDAEYQFDRHKLTFFFEAEGRVDFRELVRDLFSMYKTRIWMQQLDKNTSTSAQAIVSPQAANLQIDFGTPIIAPVSEFADSVNLNDFMGGNM